MKEEEIIQTLASSSNQHVSSAARRTIIPCSVIAPSSLASAGSISTYTTAAQPIVAVRTHTCKIPTNNECKVDNGAVKKMSKEGKGGEKTIPEQLIP